MPKRVRSYLRFAAVLVAALAALPALAADAAPPSNDAFATPILVPQALPYTNTQDASESSLEPLDPPHRNPPPPRQRAHCLAHPVHERPGHDSRHRRAR